MPFGRPAGDFRFASFPVTSKTGPAEITDELSSAVISYSAKPHRRWLRAISRCYMVWGGSFSLLSSHLVIVLEHRSINNMFRDHHRQSKETSREHGIKSIGILST